MDFLSGSNIISIFIKLFGIVSAIIYFLFAWILIRQIGSLEKTIDIPDDGLLDLLAKGQLLLAVVILLFALFIL